MKKMKRSYTFLSILLVFILASFPSIHSSSISITEEKQCYTITNEKAWTCIYYIDADWNNFNIDILETKFIKNIASAENIDVIVLQDKQKDPATLYYIEEDHQKTVLEEMGEINMADPQTLTDLISYCKNHYPSQRYQLCIWSHANAWYGACKDDTSGGDIMTLDEFHQALYAVDGIDLLCFIGCCQMGSLEAVYELKDDCDVYVSSEAEGYGPHWYDMLDEMCHFMNSNLNVSTIDCGKQIAQLINDNPNEFEDELTISAIRTDKISILGRLIDQLSTSILENDSLFQLLSKARNESKEFDFIQESYLIDLYDLVDNYLTLNPRVNIREILQSIKENLSQAVIAEFHGSLHKEAHGLSIFYSSKDMISTYANYDLDFTADTHWDELLDEHKESNQHDVIELIIAKLKTFSSPLYHFFITFSNE